MTLTAHSQSNHVPAARPCPLCSAMTPRRALAVATWVANAPPYVQCERCGLVFHGLPIPTYDEGPPLSLESYIRGTTWKLPTNRERVNWLTRHVGGRRGRAADIGTRDGSAVKALLDRGWDATGFDPDTRFHQFAKQTYGIDIRRDWFTSKAVGRGSLDLVTAYHVLEHVQEPLAWLSEIRDALKPDGHIHIETPNLRVIEAQQLIRGHAVLYTKQTLRHMLETAGFRVLSLGEFAPGGNRSYDQLNAFAQRDEPKQLQLSLSEIDRFAQESLARPTPDLPPSPILGVRVYRAMNRRIRRAVRRSGYRFLP